MPPPLRAPRRFQDEAIKARVVEEGADIGLALDGDADRLIVIDEKGQAVDGDQIMALIGGRMAAAGTVSYTHLTLPTKRIV